MLVLANMDRQSWWGGAHGLSLSLNMSFLSCAPLSETQFPPPKMGMITEPASQGGGGM